jgi:hypothetical protein
MRRFLEIDQSETRIACGGNIILNIKFDKDVACQIMHKRWFKHIHL